MRRNFSDVVLSQGDQVGVLDIICWRACERSLYALPKKPVRKNLQESEFSTDVSSRSKLSYKIPSHLICVAVETTL